MHVHHVLGRGPEALVRVADDRASATPSTACRGVGLLSPGRHPERGARHATRRCTTRRAGRSSTGSASRTPVEDRDASSRPGTPTPAADRRRTLAPCTVAITRASADDHLADRGGSLGRQASCQYVRRCPSRWATCASTRSRGEWVNIVGHRQARPNLPSEGCPFCVGGLEAPDPYDVRWFPNRWPAFAPGDADRHRGRRDATARRCCPRSARCEVVLFSPDHDAVARDAAGRARAQGRRPVGRRGPRRCSRGPRSSTCSCSRTAAARSARPSTTRTGRSTATRSSRPAPAARPTRRDARLRGVPRRSSAELEAGERIVCRARRLGRVGPVRVARTRTACASRRAHTRRFAARARRRGRDDLARTAHRRARPLRPALARAAPGLPLPVSPLVPPGARVRRRRVARARAHRAAAAVRRRAALRRVGRARQRRRCRIRSCPKKRPASCAIRGNATMPERRFRAPGRVNLIGGQVDYHEGWVVSMAIDRDVVVAIEPRADGRIVARSADLEGTVDIAADATRRPAARRARVGTRGRAACCDARRTRARRGRRRSRDHVRRPDRRPASRRARRSRSRWRSPCADRGGLRAADRRARARRPSGGARRHRRSVRHPGPVDVGVRHALDTRCVSTAARSRSSRSRCPTSLAVVVIHSGVARTLEGSPWQQRRADSDAVAAALGLPVLRDARSEQVADEPRGRHVVSEIARVVEFARRVARR